MFQRNVELLIGGLLTDEEKRRQFVRMPARATEEFCRQGWELTQGEFDALATADATMWSELATRIPTRLRFSLRTY